MSRRIGLLTLPLHTNYGGILQVVALRQSVMELGYEPILLDRYDRPTLAGRIASSAAEFILFGLLNWISGENASGEGESAKASWRKRRFGDFAAKTAKHKRKAVHKSFVSKMLPVRTSALFSSSDMMHAAKEHQLHAVIVGSDQVWRVSYQATNAVEDYFLGFAEGLGVRRISYAASFGGNAWGAPDQVTVASRLLSTFDAVSVREKSGVALCASLFDRTDAQLVLDPTLLVEPDFYRQIAAPPARAGTPILLEYILDPEPQLCTIGADLTQALGSGFQVRSLLLDSSERPITIPQWLRAFMDADFVVTNSYHGMVFSIMFEKPFLAVVNKERGADRFVSLLTILGLEDRLLSSDGLDRAEEAAARPIDYGQVRLRLRHWRETSRAFLENALMKSTRPQEQVGA